MISKGFSNVLLAGAQAYYRLDGGFEAVALEMLTGKPAISALGDLVAILKEIPMGFQWDFNGV